MKNLYLPVHTTWISLKQVVFFILFCLSCPSWGQGGKKLEPSDYSQWETMLPNKLSYDGKWVSYGLAKDNSAYQIVVQNTQTSKKFVIDSCYLNNFSAKGKWFSTLDFNANMTLIDLRNQRSKLITKVQNYQFAPSQEHLAYLQRWEGSNNGLMVIKDLEGNRDKIFNGVAFYTYSPDGSKIALLQKHQDVNSIIVFNLLKWNVLSKITVTRHTSKIEWQPDSLGMAFWEENGGNNEMFWWLDIADSAKVKKFNARERNLSVLNIYNIPFYFSNDGKRLFFQAEKLDGISKATDTAAKPNVEVWNAKDEFVYPAAQSIQNNWIKKSFTIAWNKMGEKMNILGTEESSIGIGGEEGQFAYSYSTKENSMATWDKDIPSPIIVYDIGKEKQKTILQNNYTLNSTISPSGRYLTYFKEGNWFLYDAKNDAISNLTMNIETSFTNFLSKEIPQSDFGPPIWTENEKELALYDGFDIWLITLDGLHSRKLTNGKETNRKFRFHLTTDDFVLRTKFGFRHSGTTVNLSKGAILNARDMENGSTGYFSYSRKNGIVPIVFGNALYSNLRMSGDGKTIVYASETYDNPPKIIVQDLKSGTNKTVYQSNPQHFDYKWGQEELVNYTTPGGEPLKGILYYPANFDPTKKYPMIVSIYEIQSKDFYKYYNPTLHSRIGFGISNFTTSGYFVFLPDIVYELGNPGISALDCVLEGLDTMADRKYIDKEKIGLNGHSFGGYESMFILTQTDRFATVVAGAGASNLLSFYLSMSWIWDRPQYTRFERQQWRMGDTYFNIPEAYNRNSPINFAQNISASFLGWAGKKDSNVNWEQHLEFYLALRKLEKEHIMLLYPEEGHDITTPANQEDLTYKIMEWYDFYLKEKPAPQWMKEIN